MGRKSEKWTEEQRIAMGKLKLTHGMTRTPEHVAWMAMRKRCRDKNFKGYGARGITVCARWEESFENFYQDMGPRPQTGVRMSLERIDNNGNYEPGNCKWATYLEQNRNRTPGTAQRAGKKRQQMYGCLMTPEDKLRGSKKSVHIQWHLRRGINKIGCALCKIEWDGWVIPLEAT